MKKLKQKSNAKPVGAGLVPAQNKGITLIALIITIIVMLILVGVTINVSLNGGLFEKAKDAKEKTAAATEKEQLLNAVFATLDDNGRINLDSIQLPDGFKESESSDNVFIGPSGKEYEVSKSTGAITDVLTKEFYGISYCFEVEER